MRCPFPLKALPIAWQTEKSVFIDERSKPRHTENNIYLIARTKLLNVRDMGKTAKRIWNIITSVIVALAVLLAIALVGVRLVGFQVFTVLSGSMEPTYHVGSLIYVKKADYTQLQAGDVITFMLDEDTVATHRIVEVVPDEEDASVLRFRTKGDANAAEDGSLVHYKNVVGVPVFSIPKLGYLANYIQNPPGTYVAVSAGAILLLLVFLPDLFGGDGEQKPKKHKAQTAPDPSEISDMPDSIDEPRAAEPRTGYEKKPKGGRHLK